jgi:hypothetical protein
MVSRCVPAVCKSSPLTTMSDNNQPRVSGLGLWASTKSLVPWGHLTVMAIRPKPAAYVTPRKRYGSPLHQSVTRKRSAYQSCLDCLFSWGVVFEEITRDSIQYIICPSFLPRSVCLVTLNSRPLGFLRSTCVFDVLLRCVPLRFKQIGLFKST